MSYVTDGRWQEILPFFGAPLAILNHKHQACPSCGGSDRFRFIDTKGSGSYVCNQCGSGNGFSLLMKITGCDFDEAYRKACDFVGSAPPKAQRPEAPKPDYRLMLRQLYRDSKPISAGDPVDLYLRNRGIPDNYPRAALRYVPAMYHAKAGINFPGMIATISDPDGNPSLLHRTYLTLDGQKAPVDPRRMLMPGEFPKGGAIRLGPPAETMGVAEGIETALTAAHMRSMPVWSTVAEGFMRTWQPPSIAKHIVIFGDNDLSFVGQCAAYTLAKRLIAEGMKVDVMIPRSSGWDWNDIGMKGGEFADAA